MRVLVLGANGLIGNAVARRLIDGGHDVVGLGRDLSRARRQTPQVRWVAHDLATLATADDWRPILDDAAVQAIVNAAGALQDGSRDDVARVQLVAMRALYAAAAAAGVRRFVQISAVAAGRAAGTVFMRTKVEADAALAASALEWVVLRPGLVIAPEAYGGTALLRALAAMPLVQPLAYPDATVRTVAVAGVAQAVVDCVEGRMLQRRTYDLVEDEAHTLRAVVGALRQWLGIAPAPEVVVATGIMAAAGRFGDLLGWLGWRPALRTTALIALASGIDGDPEPWRAAGGVPLTPLDETLRRLPSTVQERWFARLFLLKPALIAVLAAFWLLSGVVALAEMDAAARVLASRGMGADLARAAVVCGAIADIGLGLAILRRSTMPWAAHGMIAVSLAYIALGTLLARDLWSDPLGPLVKIVPAALLAVVALALAEDR